MRRIVRTAFLAAVTCAVLVPLSVPAGAAVPTAAPSAPSATTDHKGMSPNSSTITPFVDRANEKKAFDYFVAKGLSKKQAAGIVGNFDQESQMDPAAKQSGGAGRGIAQWSVGGRWDTNNNDNQVDYTASHGGGSSFQLDIQLAFTWYELTKFSSYGLSALKATNYVKDAVNVFQNRFEGCGDCNNAARIKYADEAYDRYK